MHEKKNCIEFDGNRQQLQTDNVLYTTTQTPGENSSADVGGLYTRPPPLGILGSLLA